ncbi:AT-hook motif nuclear-localized protein 10-like [Iris pallida]|uniref:AT-hook motif nuclear-localized protein n=1 Tax=Iris pallida TaxID=29817 RepID=A0AAX6DW19_IRIPA|nr:AT-hook motif nuclear-localized protein 10-like [Iris pallida]
MEVRSEPSIMATREPFTIQKSPAVQPQPPSMQNMRLTFAPTAPPSTSQSPPPPRLRLPLFPTKERVAAAAEAMEVAAPGSGNGPSPMIPGPHGLNINMGVEPVKRKRGRPRKYGPDGTMALAITPVSPASVGPPSGGNITFSSPPTATGSTPGMAHHSADAMKKRGRPSGSSKKMQMAALGSAGTGFIPCYYCQGRRGRIIKDHVILSKWTSCSLHSFCKWCHI